MTPEERRQVILDFLGFYDDVESVCKGCGGLGRRVYGSTATWRGGVGGQAMTSDVCDKCWGTGSRLKKGVDLKKLFRLVSGLEYENKKLKKKREHGGNCYCECDE